MGYRIPSEEAVRSALRRVLTRTGGVATLKELTRLVRADLHEEDPAFRLGPARVRQVAGHMNAVRMRIYARSGHDQEAGRTCPVCGEPLKRVRNRTLDGQEVPLQARCTGCPYWTGRVRRVPTRYSFHLREWRFADPDASAMVRTDAKGPKPF